MRRRAPGSARDAACDRVPLEPVVRHQARGEVVRVQLRGPQVLGLHVRAAVVLRGAGQAVGPAGDRARGVERRNQLMVSERAEEIVLQVVRARPHQLDRQACRFRDQGRLGDEVVGELAPEAAARARHLDRDRRPRDAGRQVDGALRARGLLERPDDAGAVRHHVHEAVLGLERRVAHEWHAVARADHARRGRARGGEIAVVAHDLPAACEQLAALGIERGARLGRVWPARPFDLERLAALERGPGVVRHHGDPGREVRRQRLAGLRAGDDHHRAHAGDRPRRAIVEARDVAVEVRAAQHDRGAGARLVHVDAVARAARDDLGCIHDLLRAADDAVFAARLQRRRLRRHRQCGGLGREIPIRQAPAVRVQRMPVARGDGFRRDAPARRGGPAHQRACLGADLAQVRPGVRDVGAAACTLRAVLPLRRRSGEIDAERQLLHRDVRPGRIQLVGDDHRQRSLDALPDLGAARADEHAVVALDAQVQAQRVGRQRRVLRERGPRQHGLQQQPARGGQRRLQEAAAGNLRCRGAHFGCRSRAARAIARRMRT